MKLKVCNKCNVSKCETDFYKKGKNRIQSYCKSCFNKYCSDRWISKKMEAINYLGGCCSVCGYKKYYGALEFHHKNPNNKSFEWGRAKKLNKQKMFNELNKCVLLCSNCHRELHDSKRTDNN